MGRGIPRQAQPSFYETTVAGMGKTGATFVITYLDVQSMVDRRWTFEQANDEAVRKPHVQAVFRWCAKVRETFSSQPKGQPARTLTDVYESLLSERPEQA